MPEQHAMRRMELEDLASVMLIEEKAYPHPWAKTIFVDSILKGYFCQLCAIDHAVVGYAVMSTGAGEAHILNICIDDKHQNKGFGRDLLHHMMALAKKNAVNTLFLEVRISNFIAKQLYESEGFNEIGLRKGYYPAGANREDALVFAKEIL